MAEGNTSPDQGGGSLRGFQRGGPKDAADSKVVCVLDLPGDLKIGRQESGAPEGTAIKRTGVQADTTEFTDSFEGRQAKTGQGRGIGHQIPHGVGSKSGGVEVPCALVQAIVGGVRPHLHENIWTA